MFRLMELSTVQCRASVFKYQLNSGSTKPPFVLPLEQVTELYLEKNKLQELTFLEAEEKPGKISHAHKESTVRRVSVIVMISQGACW